MKNKLVVRSRNVLKRNALRFAAALLVALASLVAAPNAALTQAPQHHDQVPGFYRQKVGDLEVTALFDGHGVFDPHWLNGTKATMDGVVEALHEDPRLLDVSDEGFLRGLVGSSGKSGRGSAASLAESLWLSETRFTY